MTKNEYLANAKPNIVVTIDGIPYNADVKEFSTGSVGYNASGKVKLTQKDGTIVTHQLSCNITAIGSREWTKEAA